eukprot:SAG11_NODE_584_length_8351_cov_159.783568_3_plen_151_part_00
MLGLGIVDRVVDPQTKIHGTKIMVSNTHDTAHGRRFRTLTLLSLAPPFVSLGLRRSSTLVPTWCHLRTCRTANPSGKQNPHLRTSFVRFHSESMFTKLYDIKSNMCLSYSFTLIRDLVWLRVRRVQMQQAQVSECVAATKHDAQLHSNFA